MAKAKKSKKTASKRSNTSDSLKNRAKRAMRVAFAEAENRRKKILAGRVKPTKSNSKEAERKRFYKGFRTQGLSSADATNFAAQAMRDLAKVDKKAAKSKDVTKVEIKKLASKVTVKNQLKPRGTKNEQRKAYYIAFRKDGHSAVDATDFAAAAMKRLRAVEGKKPASASKSTRKPAKGASRTRKARKPRVSAPRGPAQKLTGKYREMKQSAMIGAARKSIKHTAKTYMPLGKLQANIIRLNQIIRARGGVGLV